MGRGPRASLAAQCARALAGIHSIDPAAIEGLPAADPLGDPLPFSTRWARCGPRSSSACAGWPATARRRARGSRCTVTSASATSSSGPDGLRGVLDWELAHAGDPAEDVGWLCAPAWRFGGRGEVGGFGSLDELLDAYAVGGRRAHGTATGCTGGRCTPR